MDKNPPSKIRNKKKDYEKSVHHPHLIIIICRCVSDLYMFACFFFLNFYSVSHFEFFFITPLLWCVSNWLSTHRIFYCVALQQPTRIDVSFTYVWIKWSYLWCSQQSFIFSTNLILLQLSFFFYEKFTFSNLKNNLLYFIRYIFLWEIFLRF